MDLANIAPSKQSPLPHPLVFESNASSPEVPKESGPEIKIRKKITKRAQEDGFFKTGVEVIEDEAIDYDATAEDAAKMVQKGLYTQEQLRDILEKKLKDDRIFSYESFDEFNDKYFTKELVAFEEFHKIRQLKYARVKYNNRFNSSKNKLQALKDD